MLTDEPGYVALHRTGELCRRAAALRELLEPCELCPRRCGARRLSGEVGYCGVGERAVLARACHHRGEEPPLSGTAGAGTLFFAGCNLRCDYCQNHQISRGGASGDAGVPVSISAEELPAAWVGKVSSEVLAEHMLALQARGCHNIALVTPSHVVAQVVAALAVAARQGLRIPVVYNSSAYDRVAVLRALDGVVDVYLPDLKYGRDGPGEALSHAPDYVARSRAAVREMARQVGPLVLDEHGLARSGLILRHLVLPGALSATAEVLAFVARALGTDTTVSLMAQYRPPAGVALPDALRRPLGADEYRRAVDALERLGLGRGWVQEPESVESYVPDFDASAHPFER